MDLSRAPVDQLKELPEFNPGDTIDVHYRVKEGDKERVQIFRGVVTRKRGSGLNATFTVRKISAGIGVERIFPSHSPNIITVERIRQGDVRRANLNFLRNLRGKAARIKEKDTYTNK